MDIQELLAQAGEAIKDQKIDQAKSIYASVLEIAPKDFVANTNLGILYINSNLYNKGLIFLKIALDNHQERVEAWTNYIKHLMIFGKYKNASEVLVKGINYGLRGDMIDQYEILCLLINNSKFLSESNKIIPLFLQGKFKEILDLESTLDAEIFQESSYNYIIGICFFNLGLHKYSIQRFRKSVQLNPGLADSYRFLISLLRRSSDKAESKKYKKEYLLLKSKNTNTKSNLIKTIDLYLDKLDKQAGIPTFFDNALVSHIKGISAENVDFCQIFEHSINSKTNRFVSYSERKKSTQNKRQINGLPFLVSQGTHSLIKWKEHNLYKTTNDLVLYSMIFNEVKPEIIIELGSGSGGSAVWMADICNSLGFDSHIFSYDIKKPNFDYKNITFIEFDLNKLDINKGLPLIDSCYCKNMLVIEDAHVNTLSVLKTVNKFISSGDYLIIEDSDFKQKVIQQFIGDNSNRYKVDQFYLDFFGMNMTCSTDSIFRIF